MSCHVCRIGPHGYIAREGGIRLHRCPKRNRNQRQKWLIFCCLPSNLPDKEADRLFLCTKHFDKSDVIQSGIRTLLRHNAAPCFFPPIGAQVSTLEELEDTNGCSTSDPLVDPLDNLDNNNPPVDLMRIHKPETPLNTKSAQNQFNPTPNLQADAVTENSSSTEKCTWQKHEEWKKNVQNNSKHT